MAKIQYLRDARNTIIFPVTHENAVKDSAGVLLRDKLNSKQDIIEDIDEIREAALSGGDAYHKPATGIPASDFDEETQQLLSSIQDVIDDGLIPAFTEGEWAAIRSGINALLVNKLIELPTASSIENSLNEKQDSLVSGVNIKTVNNVDILGSGNINTVPQGLSYVGDIVEVVE